MSAVAVQKRATLNQIEVFLTERRFAAIGVSRNPKDFTRMLVREFLSRGYDVVPVNPAAKEIEGRQCFATVTEISPPVSAALLLTSADASRAVVRECAAAGVTRIWMYRASGDGAVHPDAVAFCEEHGIDVVPGECPFMFLPGTGFGHRLHGFVKKIMKQYPR